MLYSRKYTTFWKLDLFLSSGEKGVSTYSTISKLKRQRMRLDPVSETLCHFLNLRQYRKFRKQVTLSVMHYNHNLPEVILNLCSFFWSKIYDILIHTIINPLNMKHRLLYLKTQFIPRSKHFSSRLKKPISLCCKWHKLLFVLRKTHNT
jgi:hypothetical protein